jgi:hypothetical protein
LVAQLTVAVVAVTATETALIMVGQALVENVASAAIAELPGATAEVIW